MKKINKPRVKTTVDMYGGRSDRTKAPLIKKNKPESKEPEPYVTKYIKPVVEQIKIEEPNKEIVEEYVNFKYNKKNKRRDENE